MKKAPIALLLAVAAVAILSLSSTANAIPIHVHRTVDVVGGVEVEEVDVVHVAPRDSDEDGYPNAKDDCPNEPYSTNGGCKPEPVAIPITESVAPAPVETSYAPAPTSSGGCPSYMAGEASSPDAVNPTSGAAGCYQVLPSTAAAMGSACSDVNATSCVAAICAAQGDAAWVAADPCGYIGRP